MRQMAVVILASLLALTGVLSVSTSETVNAAGDWYVNPGDSIQTAINQAFAAGGGTVHVAAGIYHELIELRSGVVVQGDGAEVTTINGGRNGSVVYAFNVDSHASIAGFTITNGVATEGGGMYIWESSPSIKDCVFAWNSASLGGGIYSYHSSSKLSNCVFTNNLAIAGGGMSQYYSAQTLDRCVFENNVASDVGGGIYSPGNYSGPSVLANCIFFDNVADRGGGIFWQNTFSYDPKVTNCTFYSNSASASGGGMYCTGSTPRVTNSIMWDNSPTEITAEGGNDPVVTFSNIQGGFLGMGNIDTNPLFYDPEDGDFRLIGGSPCVDAGNNLAVPGWLSEDFEGDSRFIDEATIPDTGWGMPPIVDMGVDERDWDQPSNPAHVMLTVGVVGSGVVTKNPDLLIYDYGAAVDLTAMPDLGWSFDEWSGGLSGYANPATIIMDGNKEITAAFTWDHYALTVNTTGNGGVTKSPNQDSYVYGDNVLLMAKPEPVWTFTGWSGDLTGNTNPQTIVMDGNKSVTANFAPSGGALNGTVHRQGRTDHSRIKVTANEFTTVTTQDGSFSFNNLPIGSYTLAAVDTGFLKATKTGVIVTAGSTTDLGQLTLLGGDINGDGIVNISDFGILAVNFMKTSSPW